MYTSADSGFFSMSRRNWCSAFSVEPDLYCATASWMCEKMKAGSSSDDRRYSAIARSNSPVMKKTWPRW